MKYYHRKSNKVSTFHKNLIKKFQEKTDVTDYQLLWISFAKGLLIGIILL
tara:strand:+ start:309 stop:458 length:150 start_codon:yes stop_codon:yes gene_type:complete